MGRPRVAPVVRFMAKVDRQPTGCWLWTAVTDKDGYGLFTPSHHVQVRAHRWSYEHLVGPIPDGMQVDHLCRVHGCVNPAHLEPVTHRENQVRGSTFTATNLAKTHCPAGHPYDAGNTIIVRGSARLCRTCHRRFARESMAKKRAA